MNLALLRWSRLEFFTIFFGVRGIVRLVSRRESRSYYCVYKDCFAIRCIVRLICSSIKPCKPVGQ